MLPSAPSAIQARPVSLISMPSAFAIFSKRIGDLPQGHPPEIMALTAGENCCRHLVNFSGGEHEKHVGRRFLNGLQ